MPPPTSASITTIAIINPPEDDFLRFGGGGFQEWGIFIRQFKKLNRHQEILREWSRERVSLTVIPQTVTDAMQKVSESDTSKEEWTDVEWAVFLARAIMNRADCVSEEDLYLLHDIMIRCQVSASKLNLSITAGLQQIKIFILKNITM